MYNISSFVRARLLRLQIKDFVLYENGRELAVTVFGNCGRSIFLPIKAIVWHNLHAVAGGQVYGQLLAVRFDQFVCRGDETVVTFSISPPLTAQHEEGQEYPFTSVTIYYLDRGREYTITIKGSGQKGETKKEK